MKARGVQSGLALLIESVHKEKGIPKEMLVEVIEQEAKNFLHRGKAELASAEDLQAAGIELPAEDDDSEDLSKLTKAKLLELAKERGVSIGDAASKAQIIEAIEAAAAAGGDNEGE